METHPTPKKHELKDKTTGKVLVCEPTKTGVFKNCIEKKTAAKKPAKGTAIRSTEGVRNTVRKLARSLSRKREPGSKDIVGEIFVNIPGTGPYLVFGSANAMTEASIRAFAKKVQGAFPGNKVTVKFSSFKARTGTKAKTKSR